MQGRGRLRVRREGQRVRRFLDPGQVRLQHAEQVDYPDGQRDERQAEQQDLQEVARRAPEERAGAGAGQREVRDRRLEEEEEQRRGERGHAREDELPGRSHARREEDVSAGEQREVERAQQQKPQRVSEEADRRVADGFE